MWYPSHYSRRTTEGRWQISLAITRTSCDLLACRSSRPAVQQRRPNASSHCLQADAAGKQQAAPAADCRPRSAAAAGRCQPHAAASQPSALTAQGAARTQSGGGAHAAAQPAAAGIGHRGSDAAAAQQPSPSCRLPVAQPGRDDPFAADLAAAEAADRKKVAQPPTRCAALCVCYSAARTIWRSQHEPPDRSRATGRCHAGGSPRQPSGSGSQSTSKCTSSLAVSCINRHVRHSCTVEPDARLQHNHACAQVLTCIIVSYAAQSSM